MGGERVVRWCWVNFQCQGFLLIWIIVEQGPTSHAVGAGGGCLDTFSLVYRFFFLSPSLGYGPIWSEILTQRAVKPKTTNQPNPVVSGMRTSVYSCYHIYSKVSNKNVC